MIDLVMELSQKSQALRPEERARLAKLLLEELGQTWLLRKGRGLPSCVSSVKTLLVYGKICHALYKPLLL